MPPVPHREKACPIVSALMRKSDDTTVIIAAICSKPTPACNDTADVFCSAAAISDLLLKPAKPCDHNSIVAIRSFHLILRFTIFAYSRSPDCIFTLLSRGMTSAY